MRLCLRLEHAAELAEFEGEVAGTSQHVQHLVGELAEARSKAGQDVKVSAVI